MYLRAAQTYWLSGASNVTKQLDPLEIALQACLNGRPDVSEDIIKTLDQTLAHVRFNLGWHRIRHGCLREGLEMLDAGRLLQCYGSAPLNGKTIFNPAKHNIAGKTILLRSEGGYGDEIINARFATEIASRGAKVILSCHPTLMSLLSSVKDVAAVVSTACVNDCHYDYWLPAMSAAHVLGFEFPGFNNAERVISGAPYLKAKPELVDKWRRILKGKIKVGIRWRGNPKFEHHQFRTFDPAPLFALSGVEGVECYSLQRDEGSELLSPESEIADLGPMLTTWDETAAIISNLDLVVTSCTAIAHLAAALGVPTWILVPVMPYYTWVYSSKQDGSMFGGDTSPWHDAVRLFRQEKSGEWDVPFVAVHKALRELAGTPTRSRSKIDVCDGALS
jgi:hypothetical protein